MKSTIITGLAAILLLAISCKKESALITDKSSAPALTTDITEAGKYTSVYIHGQQWMTTNLAVTHYRNGDRIPQVRSKAKWDTLTTGAWCWYNNDSATGAVYGRLYNWYAVNDPRGLAPAGWHVPKKGEWQTLLANLGGNGPGNAGGKLKDTGTIEAGTGLWYAPNAGATNSSGFTGLPGGYRYYYHGTFGDVGHSGWWWSSTESSKPGEAFVVNLSDYTTSLYGESWFKTSGYSVRCLRN